MGIDRVPGPFVTSSYLSRRRFLAGAGSLAAAAAGLLAACGGSSSPATATSAATTAAGASTATSAPAAASPAATKAATGGSPVAAGTPASATTGGSQSASPVANGTPGGSLRTTLGAEPDTLNPFKGSTLFDRDVWDSLFDALVDDDFTTGVNGALATKWETQDATTWTVSIDPNAKFHDGSDVTAQVVKDSISSVLDPAMSASATQKQYVTQITAMDAVDNKTIKFTLNAANAVFPIQLAELKILPKGFDETKPVGAGPFQFVEWIRNQHVKVKKYAGYNRKPFPYLDDITFVPTPDENQKVTLLQSGEVDFTDTIPLPRAQEIVKAGKVQVFPVPEGTSPSSYFMPCNTRNAPLNDARVRQAINYAIDRQAMLDAAFGYGTIKSGLIPPKHPFFNPQATSYDKRDVNKAKQLLSQANVSNASLQLKFITSRAEYTQLAQIFQSNMADIGIKVDLVPEQLTVWVDEVLNKLDFQIGMTGITPGYDPDQIMIRYSATDSDGKALGWQNDEYETLLKQGRAEADQTKRKTIYDRLQVIAQENVPGLIVNERPVLYGASMAVQGFHPDLRQHTHFTTVWLKK